MEAEQGTDPAALARELLAGNQGSGAEATGQNVAGDQEPSEVARVRDGMQKAIDRLTARSKGREEDNRALREQNRQLADTLQRIEQNTRPKAEGNQKDFGSLSPEDRRQVVLNALTSTDESVRAAAVNVLPEVLEAAIQQASKRAEESAVQRIQSEAMVGNRLRTVSSQIADEFGVEAANPDSDLRRVANAVLQKWQAESPSVRGQFPLIDLFAFREAKMLLETQGNGNFWNQVDSLKRQSGRNAASAGVEGGGAGMPAPVSHMTEARRKGDWDAILTEAAKGMVVGGKWQG